MNKAIKCTFFNADPSYAEPIYFAYMDHVPMVGDGVRFPDGKSYGTVEDRVFYWNGNSKSEEVLLHMNMPINM